jgi:hypothetical protein
MKSIGYGDLVVATDARGRKLPKRALGGITAGADFAVVWVCREEEWEAAHGEGRDPEGVPWPAEDVRLRPGVAIDDRQSPPE